MNRDDEDGKMEREAEMTTGMEGDKGRMNVYIGAGAFSIRVLRRMAHSREQHVPTAKAARV